MHTVLILLANSYMEITCCDMWESEIRRHWQVRRTVDYSRLVWC